MKLQSRLDVTPCSYTSIKQPGTGCVKEGLSEAPALSSHLISLYCDRAPLFRLRTDYWVALVGKVPLSQLSTWALELFTLQNLPISRPCQWAKLIPDPGGVSYHSTVLYLLIWLLLASAALSSLPSKRLKCLQV